MGDSIFLYANTLLMHLGKFQMHWLGPYVIRFVTKEGVVQFEKLNGEIVEGLVNGSQLEMYRHNWDFVH
jgi:hypothetical protein